MSTLLNGIVISTKMKNTIVVKVEKRYQHPLYKKTVIEHKKYKVHCEDSSIKEGDLVTISSISPISKTKYFTVVNQTTKQPETEKVVSNEMKKEDKKEVKTEKPAKKAVKKPAKKAVAK